MRSKNSESLRDGHPPMADRPSPRERAEAVAKACNHAAAEHVRVACVDCIEAFGRAERIAGLEEAAELVREHETPLFEAAAMVTNVEIKLRIIAGARECHRVALAIELRARAAELRNETKCAKHEF